MIKIRDNRVKQNQQYIFQNLGLKMKNGIHSFSQTRLVLSLASYVRR